MTVNRGRSSLVRRRLTAPVTLLAAVFAFLLVACGDDDDRSDAQPAPDTVEFSEGVFNDIPRYPRSEEAGPRSSTDGVIAQSFQAEGASPQLIMEWYQDKLKLGWRVDRPVSEIGVNTYRGRWASEDHFLIVSATTAPTLGGEPSPETVVTQYSLSLEPRP